MCQNAPEEEPKSSCAARRGPTAHPGALRPDERDVGPAPRAAEAEAAEAAEAEAEAEG